MALTIRELFNSRRGRTGPGGYIEILLESLGDPAVADDNNDLIIRQAMIDWSIANIGATRDGFPLESVDTTDQLKTAHWLGTARYTQRAESTAIDSDSTFSFDTSGGSQRTTHGESHVAYPAPYAPGIVTAPNFSGGINATKSSVEGVDVEFPGMDWSETHWHPVADVDAAFKANLYALTKHVNNATFKGYPAGSVFFRGATGGAKIGSGLIAITYSFRSSPNLSSQTIAGIPGIDKKGHEYLWIYYRPQEDGDASMVVPQPVAAYVHVIYTEEDFSLLGIGT